MSKEKSCGAILFKRQKDTSIKYLLLHYSAGHWDFPKGNQEKKETEEQTAEREINEETGIKDIKFIEGFKETIKYFYKKGRKTIYKEVVFLIAQTKTEKINLSFEHIGYEWMSYENAYKRLTFNNSKEVLRKAKDFEKINFSLKLIFSLLGNSHKLVTFLTKLKNPLCPKTLLLGLTLLSSTSHSLSIISTVFR